ncbi:MAG: ribose ABC transporter permease, partial [Actinomycetota bacterium]|nr:ribose ABC transporter permease [Actinomycetota bacterium]
MSHRAARILRRNINVAAIVLIVFVLMFGFSLATPYFLTQANLTNMFRQSASSMVAAVGMTMVLGIAGIDLSIGSVLTLASAAFVVLLAHGV